jgi:tetratricopeptide (TPR) repeat protein
MIRILFLCLCFFFLSLVYAEEKTPAISPWLYKKLTKTEKLIAKKSYQKAELSLKGLLPDVQDKSYEQATILRSLSSVYALKGEYKKAAETLSRALMLNVLPKKQKQHALLNLGQLYMAVEQYAKAVHALGPWLKKNSTPEPEINVLVANAYAQLKKYRQALPYIKKAIAGSKKPKESWYQLHLALNIELKNYNSAANILKKLIQRNPDKKTYWDQLSSIYQQLKQYEKAVSVKSLAYKKGFINTEKGIIELANLLLYVDSPYKSAKLLEQAINDKKIKSNSKNWEKLANAWRMAREFDNAVQALEIASKLNDRGILYEQLGQIYVEQEKWQLATISLNKALSKGGLKKIGATYLLLGMSYYELNNSAQAEKYFLKAMKIKGSKKVAKQWLNYIRTSE